jgi:hypothetical protein
VYRARRLPLRSGLFGTRRCAQVISDFRAMGDQGALFGPVASVSTALRTVEEIAADGDRTARRICAAVDQARHRAGVGVDRGPAPRGLTRAASRTAAATPTHPPCTPTPSGPSRSRSPASALPPKPRSLSAQLRAKRDVTQSFSRVFQFTETSSDCGRSRTMHPRRRFGHGRPAEPPESDRPEIDPA